LAKKGRPTVYDPNLHPQVVKWMARSGLTVEEIASHLGVNKSTVTRWRNKYPEFCTAIKENREKADSEVEDSLLRRALGYEYEEVKQVMSVDDDGRPKIKKVEKIKKQVAPDTIAQIFWLKNRQPAKWREKPAPADNDSDAQPVAVNIQVKDARKHEDS
jgi:transposase